MRYNLDKMIHTKRFSIALCLAFISLYSFGHKITDLDRLYYSPDLRMNDKNFYIYDLNTMTVDIYSQKNNRYLSSFGRKSEGPGEFKFINIFKVYPDYIFIFAVEKICVFSLDGKLLKETRTPPNGLYQQIEDRFICEKFPFTGDKNKVKQDFSITDSNFKNSKDFYTAEYMIFYPGSGHANKREMALIRNTVKCDVYKDKIYIGDTTKGFFFAVFDRNGKPLYQINLPYEKIPITNVEKQAYVDRFVSWHGKKVLNLYHLSLPEYFPAYLDFTISDDRIYVLKYVKEPMISKTQEVYILSTTGKLLKKASLSYTPAQSYTFYKNHYYYLIDNEDTEKWELHREELK